jgi:hypothetical protein
LANAQRKASPQATGTVGVSDPVPETIALEDSDSEDIGITFSPRRQPAATLPQPKPKHHLTWIERYRKYIAGRREPLYEPFPNVSEAVLSSLEAAMKTRGGPKARLRSVTEVAHKQFVLQLSRHREAFWI